MQELNEADFDLSLTGFDPGEIDHLLVTPEDDERANAVPPVPENPVSRSGDLWLCGQHRVVEFREPLFRDAVVRFIARRNQSSRELLQMLSDAIRVTWLYWSRR